MDMNHVGLQLTSFPFQCQKIVRKKMPITIFHNPRRHLQTACFVQPTVQTQRYEMNNDTKKLKPVTVWGILLDK